MTDDLTGGRLRVGLVACAAQKLPRSAPARELYTSQLFRSAYEYAATTYDEVRILSALHGLVHPDTHLEPYDLSLASLTRAEREAWGLLVLSQLHADPILQPHAGRAVIYFHAGRLYRDPLAPHLTSCRAPLAGLGIGQQLGWYAARRREIAASTC